MELHFSSFSILLAIFFLFLLALLLRKPSEACSVSSRLPPGPAKLPFIGNLHNLVGALPHRALRALSEKYGPLMHLKLGEVSAVVVSSPEIAKAIMKTHDVIFSSRPSILVSEIMSYGSKDLAFTPYGEFWRMLRKICTSEVMSKKRVQSFRSVREEEYLNLVRWVASNEGSPIDLSEKIFSKSYETTSRIAFGKRCKEHEEFILVVEKILQLASGFDIGDLYPSYKVLHVISGIRPKLERLHKTADRIMEGIVEDHKEKLHRRGMVDTEDDDRRDDLIDVLLRYEQSGDPDFTLTMENVKAMILDIFSAGSDTSASTIDWAMSEMIRNPELLEMAQAEVRNVFEGKATVDEAELNELKFLKMVIKETLRMHPPFPLLLPRECGETCEIDGYEIPAKTKVIVNGWAINRDGAYWKDADTFDPERFRESPVDFRGSNFEFIPFGAGRRICPGMDFALPNIELPLAMLLYHFDWELPRGTRVRDMDMTEWFGGTGKRKESLHVIPKVYRDPPLAV